MDDLDFMDYIGYRIFIGEGKEFGFDDDDEEEEEEYEEEFLETEEQEPKPKRYERNYSGKPSKEF